MFDFHLFILNNSAELSKRCYFFYFRKSLTLSQKYIIFDILMVLAVLRNVTYQDNSAVKAVTVFLRTNYQTYSTKYTRA